MQLALAVLPVNVNEIPPLLVAHTALLGEQTADIDCAAMLMAKVAVSMVVVRIAITTIGVFSYILFYYRN